MNMKAIILAAGRGSRMKRLTDERPKCLVVLRGRTLLEWQLGALREAGIGDIGIVTGYKRELLAQGGLTEFHNPRWAETNMVSSLACAEEWLAGGPCVVSYSDIFYEAAAVSTLEDSLADLAVTYDPNWSEKWVARFEDPLWDAETFRLDASGSVSEIGNKPNTVDEVEGQYMGLLRYTPEGWAEFKRIWTALPGAEADRVHMTGMLQRVITEGRMPIKGLAYGGVWAEIDSETDLDFAESSI
jgi:choline kinase